MNKTDLINILKTGRIEGYIKKSDGYNPYIVKDDYSHYFEFIKNNYIYKDMYRGFNPYSGVEYIYDKEKNKNIFYADYLGYIINKSIDEKTVYKILKEMRSEYLKKSDDIFKNQIIKKENKILNIEFEGDVSSFKLIENYYIDDKKIIEHISCGGFL